MKSALFGAALALCFSHAALAAPEEPSIEHGRYIARIAGCNDCHTPGYPESGGNVPESVWLSGVPVGYQGPWGTTYPSNLKLSLSHMSEDEWVAFASTFEARPPMPWFNVRAMSDRDLRSFYRFVRSLGEPGEPMPDYVPPNGKPETPVFVFVPQEPQ